MKAMILAAGLGTRLGNLTETTPKVLVDINGKALLEIILEKLKSSGFEDVIINVHHHADKVIERCTELSDRLGMRIDISDERDALLDTGGGLYKARHFFDDEPFLLYNGDILTDMNLKTFYEYHVRKNAAVTLATRNREGRRLLLIDDNGRVRGWTNKASGIDIVSIDKPMRLNEIASMALTVLSPRVFDYMEEGVYSMISIILKMAETELVNTFRYDQGLWIDIGTPEKLANARESYR